MCCEVTLGGSRLHNLMEPCHSSVGLFPRVTAYLYSKSRTSGLSRLMTVHAGAVWS